MQNLYPYRVADATSLPFEFVRDDPTLESLEEDALLIAEKMTKKRITVEVLKNICRFVRKVIAKEPVYVGKKHKVNGIAQSIVIIPTQEGKSVFVSLRKGVSSARGASSIKVRKVVMLLFDHASRLVRSDRSVREIIKLVAPFAENHPEIESIKRRLSIMQQLDGSRYVPTNYGYVFVESEMGKKLCIFQERAMCDMSVYCDKIKDLTFSKKVIASFCKTLVGALLYFKEKNISHRDLAPKNILLFEAPLPSGGVELQVKITDFGNSCRLEDSKALKDWDSAGTLHYYPPEMYLGRIHHYNPDNKEPASSIVQREMWTLGIIIFELLYRRYEPSQRAIVEDDFEEYVDFIDYLSPYPEKIEVLEDFIPALLQKYPEERITPEKMFEILDMWERKAKRLEYSGKFATLLGE